MVIKAGMIGDGNDDVFVHLTINCTRHLLSSDDLDGDDLDEPNHFSSGDKNNDIDDDDNDKSHRMHHSRSG